MARKTLLILAVLALPSFLLVTVESGVALAQPIFAGTVSCGLWSGTITFDPPLMNGGTSHHEGFVISATLGNTASQCSSSTANPGSVIGTLSGNLHYIDVGDANNCATVFSGVPLPAPVNSKMIIEWTAPDGAPTKWKEPSSGPAFSVEGAANESNITVTGGTVKKSFAPDAAAIAMLADTGWPATIAAKCASGGLSSLTLSASAGSW
jgi:hypothetical protein